MGDTKISWCNKSWNVIAGCTKCSPGCKNCYAERQSQWLTNMGNRFYNNVVDHGKWNGKVVFNENNLCDPIHWKKPRLIFVNSMSDTFHEDVETNWIDYIFKTCEKAPQHQYLFLTKRINNAIDYYYSSITRANLIIRFAWLGISICTQKTADRDIHRLLQINAKVHFVSFEPVLERIEVPNEIMKQLDWVIIGCESGRGRRIVPNKYLYDLAWQCKRLNVPVFLKQINRNKEFEPDAKPIIKTPEPEMMEYPEV